MLEKKEVDELRFSLSHNLPNKNYGGDLLVENDTEKFDQLLDDEVDVAVYGHVHKQLLRYGSQGQQIINPGSIGMPYFDWEALKNHRAQYAVIEVEDGELINILFRKVAYDYEAELELAKSKDLPLNDKGYNPINQIVGYVLSGDPAYVPRYNNARNQIRKYERDEIVEELVRYYLKGQGVDL